MDVTARSAVDVALEPFPGPHCLGLPLLVPTKTGLIEVEHVQAERSPSRGESVV